MDKFCVKFSLFIERGLLYMKAGGQYAQGGAPNDGVLCARAAARFRRPGLHGGHGRHE